jgi:hypothetical protein
MNMQMQVLQAGTRDSSHFWPDKIILSQAILGYAYPSPSRDEPLWNASVRDKLEGVGWLYGNEKS